MSGGLLPAVPTAIDPWGRGDQRSGPVRPPRRKGAARTRCPSLFLDGQVASRPAARILVNKALNCVSRVFCVAFATGAAGVTLHAGPVGPVGPVAPAGPVGPVGPAAPAAPVAPAGPIGPVGPAAPAAPATPAGPIGPVGPIAPGSPGSPMGPAGPGRPRGPLGPAGPGMQQTPPHSPEQLWHPQGSCS